MTEQTETTQPEASTALGGSELNCLVMCESTPIERLLKYAKQVYWPMISKASEEVVVKLQQAIEDYETIGEPFSEREYKICYIENGKRHLCGTAKNIEEAEHIRNQRIRDFPNHQISILEKETVCREIRYT